MCKATLNFGVIFMPGLNIKLDDDNNNNNGLSNMCNIAHVKETKNSNFSLKIINYLLKSIYLI